MKSYSPTTSVYLGGSARHLREDIGYYRKIANTIYRYGHVLTSNWVEQVFATDPDGTENNQLDWQKILEETLDNIMRADMVIMETTWYGFAEGYLTYVALQQKKPVLCVMRKGDIEERIASGISDDLFSLQSYQTEEELEKIVDKFIHDNTLTSKDLRFNFFIDNEIYNHLRWASLKTGKTKAEIIRSLIEKEIDKD